MSRPLRVALFALIGVAWTKPQPAPTAPRLQPVYTGSVYDVKEVEDPVTPINIPKPVYPPDFLKAGICGQVDVTYIVGVDGLVEPGSLQVVRSTDPAFSRSAVLVILRGLFSPAFIAGKAVRQRVEQKVSFKTGGGC